MCQEIQVKISQIKARGDPSSKAELHSSKTLWRSQKQGRPSCHSWLKKQHRSGQEQLKGESSGMQELGSNIPTCSKASPPFAGSCPQIIPGTVFNSWDLLPQKCLPGQITELLFSNKVTLKQEKIQICALALLYCATQKSPKIPF